MSFFKSDLRNFFRTIHKEGNSTVKDITTHFQIQVTILEKYKEHNILTISDELVELQWLKGFRYESKFNFIQ